MLAPNPAASALLSGAPPLPEECTFYESYAWCLNPYLTLGAASAHLGEEIDKLSRTPRDWRLDEIVGNSVLLACGILNCLDEYLRGRVLRLPGRMAMTRTGRLAVRATAAVTNPLAQRRARRWRDRWLAELHSFLAPIVEPHAPNQNAIVESARGLTRLLATLPAALHTRPVGIPSPFSHLDLAPTDVLRLGQAFIRRFPDRNQPILLIGLRTSGSYFAPLLHALLASEGYRRVAVLTIAPSKGLGGGEARALKRFARSGHWAVIVDDPPRTSATLFAALDLVQRARFATERIKVLAPTHQASPDWFKTLPEASVITLPPERWHKQELLEPAAAADRLGDYFRNHGFTDVSVAVSRRADAINAAMRAEPSRGQRLKRVYEVELKAPDGAMRTMFVLAKSVGCGFLGYRAFLIGHRLAGLVPPLLGLRDGILYMEWVPPVGGADAPERAELAEASAAYVAARARHLKLAANTAPFAAAHDNAGELLAYALGRAYGRLLPERLMRTKLRRKLRECAVPLPTLIDGAMRRSEWIAAPQGPLKTDYEHHGVGKTTLNIGDPAYDLAETILDLALSEDDERQLIDQYVAQSGDVAVRRRIGMHKLLAGLWTMSRVQEQFFAPSSGAAARLKLHQRFMNAWHFLIAHTARHCGSLCPARADAHWRAPLVVTDVDGVLDRRVFGFPCTSAAGIAALTLLGKHGYAVALNTARSGDEVKAYCQAYGLSGGIAEHGAFLWDAVGQRQRILIDAEVQRQLDELRARLQQVPGVFLDERHRYSIRAFTYRKQAPGLMQALLSTNRASLIGDGALAPLPLHLVQQIIVDLQLNRLTVHDTTIDTTIVAKDCDKGTGLAALRDWLLQPEDEIIAIGDQEPDLAMFRVAPRSFAPANIGCRRQARLLGCTIVAQSYQNGLLEIVRTLIASDARRDVVPTDEADVAAGPLQEDDLLLAALCAADRTWSANLLAAVTEGSIFRRGKR